MNILEILNTNSGSILAIATIFLVVATAYLGYFNQKLWIAQDKPFLIFENYTTSVLIEAPMHEEDFSSNIFLKNIGKGHAFNIKFDFCHLNNETKKYSLDIIPSNDKKFLGTQEYLGFKISKISYEDINGVKINQIPYTTWSKRDRNLKA